MSGGIRTGVRASERYHVFSSLITSIRATINRTCTEPSARSLGATSTTHLIQHHIGLQKGPSNVLRQFKGSSEHVRVSGVWPAFGGDVDPVDPVLEGSEHFEHLRAAELDELKPIRLRSRVSQIASLVYNM